MKDTQKICLPLGLRLLRRFNFPRKLGILERLYGSKIAALGIGCFDCAHGVEWLLDLSDVGHRWMVYGYYEGGGGIRYALSKLVNGGVYIDSGANIGQWIAYISHLSNVKTFAFEPVPDERVWLEWCLERQADWNVEVIPVALGSEKNKLEIQCAGSRSTFHTEWYQKQNNERIDVDVDTIGSILANRSVSRITFWKLDVEGFEYEALVGADRFLTNKLIDCIYFECHPLNFEKISAYLDDRNYRVSRLHKNSLREVGSDYPVDTENFIAEPC